MHRAFSHTDADIPFHQFLDREGNLIGEVPERAADPQGLIRAYEAMALVRAFDQKAVALQRTGQLGTYASSLGQEAIGTVIGQCLDERDVFVPYYRDVATQFQRGVSLKDILLFWGGDERGSLGGGEDLPICIPIATQLTHAAGVATAMKIRRETRATLVTCGDGATSKGDFYESLNVAGVWHLPLVVVINNNQWAISVPRHQQTAARTLAQKGIAAEIPACQVDGNDVVALRYVISAALERARSDKGSTLIEAITYRLSDHTTADDATRYRDPDELKAAWENDPIVRLQRHLHGAGLWSKEKEADLAERCRADVEATVQAYLNTPDPNPKDIMDYLYATLPPQLESQREALLIKAQRQRQMASDA
ncbi:MAG: pyruvate dehydrogenase (acetyl-transferring) E1 component subunit alpha [Gammaproteobacteria bacterium]|nr:pyruvate dehydrogenase (acetyl-transferring) E1 component subunit alpha [Gammaproteobacteria bacterium]